MWVMTRYIYTLEVSQHLREGLRNMFLNEDETSSYPKIRITKMEEIHSCGGDRGGGGGV